MPSTTFLQPNIIYAFPGHSQFLPQAPVSAGILHWNLLGNGVLENLHKVPPASIPARILLALSCMAFFFIYLTAACAEINHIPFDLPEAESELVSGYNTEYSGIKFATFFLAEFTNLFLVATIATVMFLGGGSSPIPGFLDASFFQWVFVGLGQLLHLQVQTSAGAAYSWFWGSLLNPVTVSFLFWVILKTYFFIVLLFMLVRGTLPRFRIDQLLSFSWKTLIPISLFLFVLMSFLMTFIFPVAASVGQ
jgi:NADH:ubiquinone oxidoreductase subunit H